MSHSEAPAFTAHASLVVCQYTYRVPTGGSASVRPRVLPQLRKITGSGNLIGLVSALCDAYGGGMSTNGVGSVSCHFN
jgi:hypothetical protein